MSCPVHKYIKITLGPGFVIQDVTTHNETRNLVIDNLPSGTKKDALVRLLESFGGTVVAVQMSSGGAYEGGKPFFARVQMKSHREAIAVANGLNGMKALRCNGELFVRPELPRAAIRSQVSDSSIRVSWTLPTTSLYLGFDTLEGAQMAVRTADGYDWNGYWVTASIYSGIPVVKEYDVRLSGLPPNVDHELVCKRFGVHRTDIMRDKPSRFLRGFGIPQAKNRLEGFGRIVGFDVSPAPYKDGVVRAWCHFETPDIALAARELDGIEQRCLNDEKIAISRVYSLEYPIRRTVHRHIGDAISNLREVVHRFLPGCLLRIPDHNKRQDTITFEINAEDSKSLLDIRARLADIVQGELVMDGNGPLWDRILSTPFGADRMNSIRSSNREVLIVVRKLQSFIRVIGPPEKRASAIAAIRQLVATFQRQPVHTVTLPASRPGLFMHPSLIRLREKHGTDKLWLDIRNRRLCIRGDEAMYAEVQTAVYTANKEVHSHDHSRTLCPVCFDEPTPSVVLSCGDVYCKECLAGYLAAGAETRHFPLRCFGDDGKCQKPIPLHVAQDVLQDEQWDLLVAAAFNTHVVAKPDEFRFCPTPDCQQVYRPGAKDTVYSCPECLLSICPYCEVEYHEGSTCDDQSYRINGAFDEASVGLQPYDLLALSDAYVLGVYGDF
ncbi:unnamed protein product [Peniophora sp. CBMAI 1063]|nr:unnamed protein product [Peniophora sp. CBMAI 1063]